VRAFAEWRSIDSWTQETLACAMAGARAVVHAASVVHRPDTSLEEFARFNTEGTRALLAACRAARVEQIVLLSTIKVYGDAPVGIVDETSPLVPEGGYASTKVEAERLVREASQDGGPTGTVLRLCPVFGRGDKGNVRTMVRAIARRRFLLPGDGSTRKSIVHVSTVSDVVRRALQSPVPDTYVVADRVAPSIRELADTIARCLGRRRPVGIPAPVVRFLAGAVEIAARTVKVKAPVTVTLIDKSLTPTICSPARVERAFGLRCHVDLASSIDDEIAWMRESGLL
jgi:UDP-glucose 4-epimerase